MQPIPFFKNQSVRDLAWACFSNNLIDDFSNITKIDSFTSSQIPLTHKRQHWLKILDMDPTPLNEHLQQARSPRLGIYFESLWQFFISQDDEFEFIASNLQINKGNKTIGECDLIYKNTYSGRYTHLELAIKFYLNQSLHIGKNPGFSTDLQYWVGPNMIDRLDKKVNRLINHQIQLTEKVEAKKALAEINVHDIDKQIALKGMLFKPVGLSTHQHTENFAIKNTLSSNITYRQWTNAKNFHALEGERLLWKKLDRKDWISPAYHKPGDNSANLLNKKNMTIWLKDYFNDNWQPVLLCAMKMQGDSYIENKRYFITSDNWPMKKST